MEKYTTIYLVLQTQPSSDYNEYPIYALDNEEQAVEYARKLNKEYAYGVVLNRKGDYLRCKKDADYDEVHFYTVLPMRLNEKLAFGDLMGV